MYVTLLFYIYFIIYKSICIFDEYYCVLGPNLFLKKKKYYRVNIKNITIFNLENYKRLKGRFFFFFIKKKKFDLKTHDQTQT